MATVPLPSLPLVSAICIGAGTRRTSFTCHGRVMTILVVITSQVGAVGRCSECRLTTYLTIVGRNAEHLRPECRTYWMPTILLIASVICLDSYFRICTEHLTGQYSELLNFPPHCWLATVKNHPTCRDRGNCSLISSVVLLSKSERMSSGSIATTVQPF